MRLRSSLKSTAKFLYSRASALLASEPLALGIIGFACGALLASLTPPTHLERVAFGDLADELKQRASETASEFVGGLGHAAVHAKDAAIRQIVEEGVDVIRHVVMGGANGPEPG